MNKKPEKKSIWWGTKSYSRTKKSSSRKKVSSLSLLSKVAVFFRIPKLHTKNKLIKSNHHKVFTSPKNKQNIEVKPTDIIKIYKPKNSDAIFSPENVVKTKLLQHSPFEIIKAHKFQFGFKNLDEIRNQSKNSLTKNITLGINYFFSKYGIVAKFNTFVASIVVVGLSSFFVYLSLFDRFFLVNEYSFTFAEASYLSGDDVEEVVQSIKNNKFIGIFPNNQFWYMSPRIITLAAQADNPQVQSIRVVRKTWPRSVELEIQTEPILITLGINTNEYWRIGFDGSIVSKDDAGLRENLVIVERPVEFNDPQATMEDYSFEGDCESLRLNESQNCKQLNRFWFIVWLWSLLDSLDITYTKTVLPSIFDTDVIIELSSGSKLYFDSATMSKEIQRDRIVSTMQSAVGGDAKSGLINYIDFRLPKRVFFCRVNQSCVV